MALYLDVPFYSCVWRFVLYTKLYPRDRSIGRYFRQGVSVYGGLFGLFPYDTGISGQYDATAHIQYGPATAWTSFIWEQRPSFTKERENLLAYSRLLAEALTGKGGEISQSHIIPFIVGESEDCVRKAEELQRKGFYCLPVRPPTVPKGTSRIRFSLTANLTIKNIHQLIVETGRIRQFRWCRVTDCRTR